MPRTKKYEYVVEGQLPFPEDMLRYDSATVHDEDKEKVKDAGWALTPYRVRIIGEYPPTVGRWNSFGWKVYTPMNGAKNLPKPSMIE